MLRSFFQIDFVTLSETRSHVQGGMPFGQEVVLLDGI